MTAWTEDDSAIFRAIGDVAVPRRGEMIAAIVDAVPFAVGQPIGIVDLGCGDGRLAAALLSRFADSRLAAFDGSASMRDHASDRLRPFGARARVKTFDLSSLEWWDSMSGIDLVVSSLAFHHLPDAKKQYLYKAAADRLAPGGALIVADLVAPQHAVVRAATANRWDALARAQASAAGAPDLFERFERERWNHFRYPDAGEHVSALLHHLIWLRHAGFDDVDCWWLDAGHAVFGGVKPPAATSARPPRAGS